MMAREMTLLTLTVALMGSAMAQYQIPLQGKVWNRTFTCVGNRGTTCDP